MVALAAFFTGWALRNVFETEITFSDQARHALNGVALLDMVRDGAVGHPVEYLRRYFSHFPALSMPYHPPLFPAVEAVFYALLGVSPFAPRLVVALAVFGSVLLMFRLFYRVHGSAYLAAAGVIVFFSLRLSQQLAADVMLEMPALFVALGALWFMSSIDCRGGWATRQAILAGCFAAAAVWTKQVVFLGLVPLLSIAFTGHWRSFRSRGIWLFMTIFGVAAGGLALLSVSAGLTGFSKGWAPIGFAGRAIRNFAFYAQRLGIQSVVPLLLAAAAIAIVCSVPNLRRRIAFPLPRIYVCWILACLTVLLIVPAFDVRYLWFAYPAFVGLFLAAVQSIIARLIGPTPAERVILGCALVFLTFRLSDAPPRLTGPEAVAQYVLQSGPQRVLYCGSVNGSFIFSARIFDSERRSMIVRSDKIPRQLAAQPLSAFTANYGIRFVVIEENAASHADGLGCQILQARAVSAFGRAEKIIPLHSSHPDWAGNLHIFRQLKTSELPHKTLDIPFESTGDTLRLELK